MRANIENRDENPVEEYDSEANVGSGPRWEEKGGAIESGDLTPVEGY